MENTEVIKVTNDVSWVGVQDPDLVTFDIVMETKYGTSYNSYFVNAEKQALIDTVKDTYKDDYLKKLQQCTDVSQIEYIIVNHTEPDHSGCLKYLLDINPDITVVGSRQAINYLGEMIGRTFKNKVVKQDDIVDLGNKKIHIIAAPNLHWPDSIYSYIPEEKLLFTCDSFGAHYCSEKIFDDEVGDYTESFQYYFDIILKPFSKFIVKAIDKISSLEIKMICPGHGPVLRKNWKEKVEMSKQMALAYLEKINTKEKNILITYISAYGYTREMAKAIEKYIKEKSNYHVEAIDIEHISLGELEEKLVKCNALLVGSPTINQNTLLPVYKMFSLINPIRDRGKSAAVFGSYGWSGEAVSMIENHLKILKMNIVQEGLPARFFPHTEKMQQLEKFADHFVEKLNE